MTTYSDFVTSKVKSGEAIIAETTLEKAHLTHMALGIAGEAGELVDAIKKHTTCNKPLDTENVLEEIGDCLFYLTGILTPLGYSLHDAMQHNMGKLNKRYKAGYTNAEASQRNDKDA